MILAEEGLEGCGPVGGGEGVALRAEFGDAGGFYWLGG